MTVRLGVSGSGYTTAVDTETGERFYIHRLATVAEYGFSAVRHMDAHHRDGVAWQNGRDNLEPVHPDRHRTWNLKGHSAD